MRATRFAFFWLFFGLALFVLGCLCLFVCSLVCLFGFVVSLILA